MDQEELLKEYKERNVRWSNLAIEQLSFYNNLMLSLGVGFLAFCFNDNGKSIICCPQNNLFDSGGFILVSIILMGLSILSGLTLALNRLKDFRTSRSINQIRQTVYEYSYSKLDGKTPDKFSFLKRQFLFLKVIPKLSTESCQTFISATFEEQKKFRDTFRELRNISHNLGLVSWQKTLFQTLYFSISIFCYLISLL